jgi:RNA polymerase sigma-70 factor (ECF subfamily)
MEGLLGVLSEDITLWSDGGGRVRAALNPIQGSDRVSRFLFGILGKASPSIVIQQTSINGRPGIVGYMDENPMSVVTLDIAEERIQGIHIVVNPEKLGAIPPLTEPGAKEQSRKDHA